MKYLLLFSFLCCLMISCNSDSKKKSKTPSENTQVVTQQKFDLPALPSAQLQQLYANTTYIDYIFFDLPFSISQDDKPSINSNLQLLSQEKMGPISASCKPLGREFFHAGGAVAFEAEIYFENGCYGYVFYENKEAKYANKVSEEGMKFYNNIIKQAEQIKAKVSNGQ